MSKSVEEMLKDLSKFAEKASDAAKADALIKAAPADAMRSAFRAACNVAVSLAKGELKPENIPDTAPDLALIVMSVVAAKKMGIEPEGLFGDKKEPKKTGEVGKPEQSEEKCPVRNGPAHRVTPEGEMWVISGTLDEVMGKIGDLLKSDK